MQYHGYVYRLKREAAFGAVVLFLSGCGSTADPPATKAPANPPEAVGGQMAAFRMYTMARQWAQDVLLLRLENLEISEVKGGRGLSGAWRAVFVSPQLGKQREYSFAVVESEEINLRSGVYARQPVSYVANPQLKPFLIAALKIDSVKAYELAVEESGAYIKKRPDMPVQYELSFTSQTPNAAWRVIWGPSVSRSDYSIYIDASTGIFMRRSR